jgi:hypothetical protein
MSQNKKTKTNKIIQLEYTLEATFENAIEKIGYVAMSAAAVLSIVEVEHLRTQKVEVFQPAYATVSAAPDELSKGDEPIRREKEESPHSVVSYGTTMRSHPTAGKE